MNIDYELLPCPFCGSQADMQVDECAYGVGPTYYYVECSDCWARTHKRKDKSETIEYWNDRDGN